MYESQYSSNPTLTLNPFTDSIEAIAVFKSNKEFIDSLNKAIVDAGGTPESVVRPEVTLTELMNTLSLSGIRFTFDPTLKKGSNTNLPVAPELPVEPIVPETPTVLPENNPVTLPEEV